MDKAGDNIKFEWVNPENIRDCWNRVKSGLETFTRYKAEWMPEDIYTGIMQGHMHLHICFSGGYVGFIITQIVQAFDGKNLHIWAAYSEKNLDIMECCLPQLKEWKEAAKAKRITMTSPRKGWKRKDFIKETTVNYEVLT